MRGSSNGIILNRAKAIYHRTNVLKVAIPLSSYCFNLPKFRHFSTNFDAEIGSTSGLSKAGPLGPPLENLPTFAPSMLHHIYNIQKTYPDAVILTQVGSFMEIYFDQAVELASKLDLKLAKKAQTSPEGNPTVSFAGFPVQQKEKYEKILVRDLGKTVVVLMQNSAKIGNGSSEEEKRPVSRILTPGTLVSESFVDQDSNNYLAAVKLSGTKHVSLVWTDVVSGKVRYQIMLHDELGNALARVNPSEILVPQNSRRLDFINETISVYAATAKVSPYKFPPKEMLQVESNSTESKRFYLDSLPSAVQSAYVGLIAYINECMPEAPIDIEDPTEFLAKDVMQIDSRARSALEILESPKGKHGSLFSIIKRTKSFGGGRLLQEWLLAPLQNIDTIKQRQDNVSFFMNQSYVFIRQLQETLAELPDGQRHIQRFGANGSDSSNLLLLASSVRFLKVISDMLERVGYTSPLSTLLVGPLELADDISKTIESPKQDEENKISDYTTSPQILASSNYAYLRRYLPVLLPVTPRLAELHDRQVAIDEKIGRLHSELTQKFGRCELKWSPGHYYYVQVPTTAVKGERILKMNKRVSYIETPEWTALGQSQSELDNDLKCAEKELLDEFKERLGGYRPALRKAFAFADEVDVYQSLATLANEKNMVKPKFIENDTKESVFNITGGRHVTVETGLVLNATSAGGFVKNNCHLTSKKPVVMISGPNMGGKSTFIRQNAIIALLAHIGSYVPADSAELTVVDKIYCRLGAGDDLFNGRSTFMMEMLETAAILRDATGRSLAILDEVGRGTSGKDGIAIAFATIKHLADRTKCRTLFATHYGTEIWNLLDKDTAESITPLQASADLDSSGDLIFDYELKKGVSKSSYGLMIAKMAGYPDIALKEAVEVQNNIL